MSWVQTLYETYESCKGREPAGSAVLMPISHTTQRAHIEVVLDGQSNFRRASILDKSASTTLIPCTEASGGRTGKTPVNHPLCDKLQYLAGDFTKFGGAVTSGFAKTPNEPHANYLASLSAWALSNHGHVKLDAIRRYVQRGRMIEDLVAFKILPLDPDGKLLKAWEGDKDRTPAIYKSLSPGQTPEDAFVRWSVEDPGNPVSGTWQDATLVDAWIAHYASTQTRRGYCMVSGEQHTLAVQHPAKLRNSGDKAKLISANDSTGYTFRGRFIEDGEAASVGFDISQKAHNALRWLIARQGSRGDQAIVSWAVSGKPLPDPMGSTYDLLGIDTDQRPDSGDAPNAGQAFALRLKKAIAGYRAKLDPTEGAVVMGLDSATPGRLAITYYREIRGSELLARVEAWHLKCAWPQNFDPQTKFIGAPAPRDIAQAAYGLRLDEKLQKAVCERLLPCVVDAAIIPRDLVAATVRRTIHRSGKVKPADRLEWEKCLGIACALFKGHHTERNYQMALELERTSRDYLYGRLLAIAEQIEGRALYLADEKRATTAARLMQRFADHPTATWRSIELALVPYKTRLRNQRSGFLHAMEQELDKVIAAFEGDSFTRDGALTGEFLLGYHCQRYALRPTDRKLDAAESANADD